MTQERLSESERLRRAVQELPAERRALLAERLRQQSAKKPQSAAPIPGRAVSAGRYAASSGQERLFFQHELDPASVTYLLPIVLRLRGDVRPDALRSALAGMVDRHEPLRTGFEADAAYKLEQVVHAAGEVSVALDEEECAPDEVDVHLRHLTTRPFDLRRPPLLRAGLWRIRATDEWVFALCVHHIAVDGWSLGVLVEELAELYAAALDNREAELPPLPVQYVDFAVWQRDRLTGDAIAGQLEYWRRTLADAPPLEIPGDRPRPGRPTFDGASVPVRLTPALTAELDRVAHAQDATPFMVLLAGLSVVLHRWSGQSDLVVGTPVAGRPWPELEPLVGFFVNTVALRVDMAGAGTFGALLRRVRNVCLDGYAHQDVPFEEVVRHAGVGRRNGRPDLPKALLALRNVPLAPPRLPGLEVSVDELPRTGTDLDLSLELAPDADGGLSGWLVHSTDLMGAGAAQRMADAFTAVLAAVADDHDAALRTLPVLPAGAHDHLVRELSGAGVPPYPAQSLAACFEEQADATPDAVAVVADGTSASLTYRELDAEADRLAQWLLRSGVRPEDRVGVHLHRSTTLVVSLLAVLKAGAVCLPLDPGHPGERLEQVLRDAAPRQVLTSSDLAAALPAAQAPAAAVPAVPVDDPDADWRSCPAERSGVPVFPDNAACVLYTSGSTGTPKGVVLTQHGLVNRMRWMGEVFGFGGGDVVLHKTPISSDPALWEILVPLFSGGRVVLAEPERHTEPGYLVDVLARHRVTACDFVPAVLRGVLAESAFPAAAAGLRIVVCGGEELPVPTAELFLDRAPRAELCNFYGPTEVACDATYHRVRPPVAAPVSVGRPAEGVETYVLHDDGSPQPVGVAGELCLGGVQAARGYLGRPGQTAAAFVPHPYDPGRRLYRTGDRARYLADGSLEYLGRLDHQVKIRGYRVEPGEVEAALRTHPRVEEAAVLALPRPEGRHELVGYLLARDGAELPGPKELRAHLGRTLPTPMIPAAWVALDDFPLLTNGKVDRKALPDPRWGASLHHTDSAPPSGALQRVLARIWEEVLGVTDIGVRDDFFELGGHSLLATQVVSQVRELFRMDFPLHFFVEASTVAEFAELVRERGAAAEVDVDRIAELVLKVQQMSADEVGTTLRHAP